MPPFSAWLAVLTAALMLVTVAASRRDRPLRVAGPGWLALSGALIGTYFFASTEQPEDRVNYPLTTLCCAMTAYLLVTRGRPLRHLPSAFLDGFKDEDEAQRHDEWGRRHQWWLAGALLLAAIASVVVDPLTFLRG